MIRARPAVEAAGVHKARAGRSFGYAQDDETGMTAEAVGMLRAVAIRGTLCFIRFHHSSS